jgi:hypothetical protein
MDGVEWENIELHPVKSLFQWRKKQFASKLDLGVGLAL